MTTEEVVKWLTELREMILDNRVYTALGVAIAVLNKFRWTPVTEGLPCDRNWYLGIFKEPDTGWVNPLPFVCDYVGEETKATTKEFWILRGLTDTDHSGKEYYLNLECVAWMPLPEYNLEQAPDPSSE